MAYFRGQIYRTRYNHRSEVVGRQEYGGCNGPDRDQVEDELRQRCQELNHTQWQAGSRFDFFSHTYQIIQTR